MAHGFVYIMRLEAELFANANDLLREHVIFMGFVKTPGLGDPIKDSVVAGLR